jgi:sugar transferase (PEP-CTERM/EpsH1 system associated)
VNILFLTSRLPFPPVGGDRLRTFQFVRYLGRRHRVTIASFVEHEGEVEEAARYRDLYHRLVPVVLPREQSHLNCLRGLASSLPLQVHYYSSPRMRSVVAGELARERYDAVVCHLIRMTKYLPEDGGVRTVVDFCDAISLLHQRNRALAPRFGLQPLINAVEAHRVESYERAAIARADASIFISGVDADHFRQTGLSRGVTVISNGVDTAQFAFDAGPRDDNRIVFVGNMRTFPNTDAVVHFVEEVFPLIRKERPAARFEIVGNEPSKRVRALHDGRSVVVTGRVDSVIPYVAGAALVVAPMRTCAGVQNKILEALAVGTPVVTTTIGAEGLEPGILTIADAPQDFARAALELMNQPHLRRERALVGRSYVEKHYTWEKSLESLDSLLAGPRAGDDPVPRATPPQVSGTSSSR